jgi:hypothetical protein
MTTDIFKKKGAKNARLPHFAKCPRFLELIVKIGIATPWIPESSSTSSHGLIAIMNP